MRGRAPTAAENRMAEDWHVWAFERCLDPGRPAQRDLWRFFEEYRPKLAALGDGNYWHFFLEALAYNGYAPVD